MLALPKVEFPIFDGRIRLGGGNYFFTGQPSAQNYSSLFTWKDLLSIGFNIWRNLDHSLVGKPFLELS